jgi:hypothetical protein
VEKDKEAIIDSNVSQMPEKIKKQDQAIICGDPS